MAPAAARIAAGSLTLLLCFGVLALWAPERWPLGALQAGVFGLGAAWALRLARRGLRPRWCFPLSALAGVLALGLLELAFNWTVYRFATWDALLTWAMHLTVAWLAVELLSWRELRVRFRSSLLWFGFLLSVASTIFYFATPGKVFGLFPVEYRAVGPFLNRDHYSTFVELILPLALWEALRDPRKAWSRGLMAGTLLASVVAGASRAGSILVTLEILLMLFLGWRARLAERNLPVRAVAWTGLFGVAFVAVVGWEVLWQRFQEPDPYRGRREMLQSSLAMLRDRPWTGFGMGTWRTVYPAYAIWILDPSFYANNAHNDWAEWGVEGGLPMLLLLAAVGLWSLRRALEAPWGLGVAAALAHCAVDFPMRRPALAAVVFALVGALGAIGPSKNRLRGGTQPEPLR